MKLLDLENAYIKEDMENIFISGHSWDKLKGTRVLITGASGMIASYMTLFLVYLNEYKDIHFQIGAEVRNRQKLENCLGKYIAKEYFEVLEGDIFEIADYGKTFDYIIHAASLASPQYYGTNPVETMVPNIIGTNHLLSLMKDNMGKGFLFFSSGSVYGSVENCESLEETMAGPLQFLSPGNVYGESKRCGEALCMAYFREFGVPVNMVRIHHTYGPTMNYKNDKRVFSSFVNNIIKKEDIVMRSDGSDRRAFCYITDMLAGIFLVLLDAPRGEVYNIANEEEYISIKQLAEKLVSLYPERNVNVKIQLEMKDNYCASKEKRIIPVNCDKIKTLGWDAKVSIEEGFQRTIDYFLEDENIFELER